MLIYSVKHQQVVRRVEGARQRRKLGEAERGRDNIIGVTKSCRVARGLLEPLDPGESPSCVAVLYPFPVVWVSGALCGVEVVAAVVGSRDTHGLRRFNSPLPLTTPKKNWTRGVAFLYASSLFPLVHALHGSVGLRGR